MRETFRRFDDALRHPRARHVGIALIVLSLAANAAVGVLTLDARSDASRLVSCLAKYHELDGAARDSRAADYDEERVERIEAWEGLGEELTAADVDPKRLAAVVDDYLTALRDLEAQVGATPYPSPDLCVERSGP